MKFDCGCEDTEHGMRLCALHTDPYPFPLRELTGIVDLENATFVGSGTDVFINGVKQTGLFTVWIYFEEERL